MNTYPEYKIYEERILEMMVKGYKNLLDSATKTGHWKYPRCTALVAMALDKYNDGSDNHKKWTESIREWIINKQEKKGDCKGSWGEEVWDTAMCILALKELGVSTKDENVISAFSWMKKIYLNNRRSNWHDEPWETSWALMAILKSGIDTLHLSQPSLSEELFSKQEILSAIKWLKSCQSKDGKIISPHYTAYFLIISDYVKRIIEDDNEIQITTNKCVKWLIKELTKSRNEVLWAGEAWSNGQILLALNRVRKFPFNTDNFEKTVKWFEVNQLEDGGWSDVEDTASAILGLWELMKELCIQKTVGTIQEAVVIAELKTKLRKRVNVPKLVLKKNFIERDEDPRYIKIQIRRKIYKAIIWFGWLIGFILGTLISILVDLKEFLDMIWTKK